MSNQERDQLQEAHENRRPWYRWGPYLSECQWGTVREDYSPDGAAGEFLPHDQARSHTYRWGEDGLMGISDDRQQLCFALGPYDDHRPVLAAVEAEPGPTGEAQAVRLVHARHHELGDYWLAYEGAPELLFTENESNAQRLWGTQSRTPFVKDGIHETVVKRAEGKVNPQGLGTKVAAHYRMVIAPGTTQTVLLRLAAALPQAPFDGAAELFTTRIEEENDFYQAVSTAQAEAWMGMSGVSMLAMALELARESGL